jgi:hypothetical protein
MKLTFRILAAALTAATTAAPSIASAAPLAGIFHLHPAAPDSRIHYAVFNQADRYYQVRIAGKTYEILPHRILNITAPVGTQVYAAIDMHFHKNGTLLHEITTSDNAQTLILN